MNRKELSVYNLSGGEDYNDLLTVEDMILKNKQIDMTSDDKDKYRIILRKLRKVTKELRDLKDQNEKYRDENEKLRVTNDDLRDQNKILKRK
ncbi:MAG: hypothetical protein CL470_05995 [Acidimicrobiaceae bacterium]|nr:hypothetical protein [Acidimicrobiaceae bacterium]|tara:strand:- start:1644 stop:1919 length:276 start_codon:yes stop_codon:yes gene_type:complete